MNVAKLGPSLSLTKWTNAMTWALLFGLMNPLCGAKGAEHLRLEDMHLKQDKMSSNLFVQTISRSSSAATFLGVVEGYDLSQLQPFVGLFSEKHFVPSSDRTQMTDTRTGSVFTIPVYRAAYDDGSIALAEMDGGGNIVYIEIRRPRGVADIFLIPRATSQVLDAQELMRSEDSSEFLAFTEDDVDYDELRSKFHYAEDTSPEDLNRKLRRAKPGLDSMVPNLDYQNGRDEFVGSPNAKSGSIASAGATACQSYQVVRVGIVFDAEFCSMYGSFEASRRRIMTIVASASIHYERDMCVQLQLTDIYTPEITCYIGNSFFRDFNRLVPCGGSSSFLSRFAAWMKRNRNSLRIDDGAAIQMFSGFPPPGGTIGCAFVGSLCNKDFSYGIEYMSFAVQPHSQGVVVTHEIGHILSAPHLILANFDRHVMEPNINDAANGFHPFSISSIMTFLNSDDIKCDGFSENTERRVALAPPIPTNRPSSPRPTLLSASPPDNGSCVIFEENTAQPKCIFTSKEDGYTCFESSSLLGVSATSQCLFQDPVRRILRCAGPLRTGQIGNIDTFGTPETFTARSCNASCVVVSNFLCFRRSSKEIDYSISFVAVADVDVSKDFQRDVFVRQDEGITTCSVATTTCIDL